MEKAIFTERAPIWLSPERANAGHEWENHAAPEWETQCQYLSPWATQELRQCAWIKASQALEIGYRLGLIKAREE